MATALHPKSDYQPNEPKGTGLVGWLARTFGTAVGSKQITAVTGLALVGFVVAHLTGNLKLYAGQASINHYAHFLKELGPLLWVARAGLLAFFLVHIVLVIRLKARTRAARPVAYSYQNTVQASVASRTMLTTGLVVLAFVLFHLAHYTFGIVKKGEVRVPESASQAQHPEEMAAIFETYDVAPGSTVEIDYMDLRDSEGLHDVYSMVVYGFQNYLISGLYILTMLIFFWHLNHGFSSAFQTLGANTPRWQRFWKFAALGVALFVVVGNISLPTAVMLGWINPNPDVALTLGAAYSS